MARYAHVQLLTQDDGPHLLVDGLDITKSVLAEGFSITEDSSEGKPAFRVAMTLMANVDADLPTALLDASQAEAPRCPWDGSKESINSCTCGDRHE